MQYHGVTSNMISLAITLKKAILRTAKELNNQ